MSRPPGHPAAIPVVLVVLVVLSALVVPSRACACLWDYDTVLMERASFPDALELITGKFLRHSRELYDWRIHDRLAKLAEDPERLEWLDDLAVAYDKTGDHRKAIATMERAEAIAPGRYETAANLGTFLIHAGDLEAGLVHRAALDSVRCRRRLRVRLEVLPRPRGLDAALRTLRPAPLVRGPVRRQATGGPRWSPARGRRDPALPATSGRETVAVHAFRTTDRRQRPRRLTRCPYAPPASTILPTLPAACACS